MSNVKVKLRPLVNRVNMPTALKTAVLPGETYERLFIATQVGEIYYIGNGVLDTLLDIRSRVLRLGLTTGGYDERGLLGLAFHPGFTENGLFYLHYSVAGTQGPGALAEPFFPNPCNPETLNLKWTNREIRYDHIDTVEEWIYHSNGQTQKRRTLLNLRRPFLNHNGVNSLNFSPETGKLVLTTGDGGSGYDPFNLSQDDMEIAGKIIEIDVNNNTSVNDPPVATRFNELPIPVQEMLTVIAKGVRNIPGISFQRINDQYIKYIGNVGQDLVESVYSFVDFKPIPVKELVQASLMRSRIDWSGFVNFGWRGWEGSLPTSIIKVCNTSQALEEKTIAYYDDAIRTLTNRIQPLTNYYHTESRIDKFSGIALTGVQVYMGNEIPGLKGNIVFTDLARSGGAQPPVRGVLAYTSPRTDCNINDYGIIEADYDFGFDSAYYVSLGTNQSQDRLYLGVYSSLNVTDANRGTVFEIVQ